MTFAERLDQSQSQSGAALGDEGVGTGLLKGRAQAAKVFGCDTDAEILSGNLCLVAQLAA